jgi:hypothetical protein
MSEEANTGETAIVDETATEQAPPENLTLRELDQLAQVIDLGSQRGAFRAGELEVVGSLYNKLVSFLSYVQAQQEAAAEAAEGAETEEGAAASEGE